MDVFKIRPPKQSQNSSVTIGTLDSVHQDTVTTLRETKIRKDELEDEKKQLQMLIAELADSTDLMDIVQCRRLETRIVEIENELNQNNPVEDYYLKHMDLLMDYYGPNNPSASAPVPMSATNPKDVNTFMKFFTASIPSTENAGSSRKKLFDEYVQRMRLSNGPEAGQIMTEHCNQCNVACQENTSEGILVCPSCGTEERTLVVSDLPSFRDPPKERNNYAYKKINHLNEILNQFQAKESTIIPEEVMNEVVLEVRKRRITNVADLSEKEIREILKKLGRSKYYEHTAHILNRLNGNPPPTITPEIEEKIRAMFQEIQAPFLIHCPNERTNFLSYSYILYKFFELLDLDEYKVYFPLLKSRDRLLEHDRIWQKICNYLQWEYISSI